MTLTTGRTNRDVGAISIGAVPVRNVYRGATRIWPTALGRMTLTVHAARFEPESMNSESKGVFELPFDILPTYVDWGDGSTERAASHGYYRANQTWHITLEMPPPGAFWFQEPVGWSPTYTPYARKGRETLISIDSSTVDFSRLTTLCSAFYQCTNLDFVPENLFASAVNVASCQQIFDYCRSLTSISGNLFAAMTKVTNFWRAFSGSGLKTIPANLFARNTKARDFRYCFGMDNSTSAFFTALESVPATLFDSIPDASDLNLDGVFWYCDKITSALPPLWTTHSNCSSHYQAFSGCKAASNYADVPLAWR